ncbi:DUF2059 domain-containing protein [Pseudomonas leptonychotis]|uniref:DUF2059 domain-containing protein n=1 Tax=Pseudomonas leptonychotis TaxID=2448482 RepID=UPI0039EF731F
MRHLVIVLSIIFSAHAFADSKSEKIEGLMKALGLVDTWTQQIEQGKIYNRKISSQMLDQILSQLNPNKEFQQKFKEASDVFITKTESPWSPEKIVEVWASYYGPEFTEDELDELTAFYTSPLGQKDIRVTRGSMEKFAKYFQEAGQPILEKATAEYIQDMKIIAQKCNCAK